MNNWKSLLLGASVFIFLLILFLTGGKNPMWSSIALGGLMIFLWVFELIPIYVTALLPMVLAVPLGVLETGDLAKAYGNNNVYLFFGGFVLALALEKWNIHEQIARGIINFVGKSKSRILFGFLISTGVLSMWISNTATALMMLPMATAVIHSMPSDERKGKFSLFLLLSVAYAASVGGMATLVGSPPNMQMKSILEQNYGLNIDFFHWMKIALPISLLMLLAIYVFFYFIMGSERKSNSHSFEIHKQKWTRDQIIVLVVFLGVVIMWSFKDLIEDFGLKYKDEGPAILGAILLFILPSSNKKPFLVWKDTEKLPWGILLLFGGGLALAAMLEQNGVITELTTTFRQFSDYPVWILIGILVTIAIFATEIMSNLALVTIFIPLIAAFATESNIDILQLCLPITMAASCAFMLPVGTPPNAIVFSSGQVKISDMAKYGFVLNVIGVLLVSVISILFL
jgi:sodium-dependent dicarboxylate transporter 2/3/5